MPHPFPLAALSLLSDAHMSTQTAHKFSNSPSLCSTALFSLAFFYSLRCAGTPPVARSLRPLFRREDKKSEEEEFATEPLSVLTQSDQVQRRS